MAWFGKSAKSLNASGSAYAMKGQFDSAIADFDEAIRFDPQYADGFYNRGLAYASKGQYDRAIADFDEAIRLNPKDADFFAARGRVSAVKDQFDRTIADFDEAARLKRLNSINAVVSFVARGAANMMIGQHSRAYADFDEAIRLDPKFTEAINRRAEPARKDELDGETSAEALATSGMASMEFAARGVAHYGKREYDRAIADFDEAIRIYPKNAAAFGLRGSTYMAKGQYDRAIADYDEAIRLDPKVAGAFHGRGCIYAMKDKYDRAIADYDEAIRLNPNFTLAIEMRAMAIARKNQLGSRTELLEQKSKSSEPINFAEHSNQTEACNDEDAGYDGDLMTEDELLAGLEGLAPQDTPDNQFLENPKLITEDDVENYGYELIDLIKRAAKEAVGPELNALRQEFLSQVAAK